MKYQIIKRFISGNLEGIEYTEITDVNFVLNKRYKGLLGSSDYIIIKKAQY
jgi:hypothetical protein